MRELTFLRPGRLEWREAPEPALEQAGDAIVRPLTIARCDLDLAILRGEAPFKGSLLHFLRNHLPESIGQKGIFHNAPFRGPYPFGHEAVAEVLDVGNAVTRVRPGDRVIVPFQISCGECGRCRRGLTSSCESVPPRSMYGFGELGGLRWGGMIAERTRVPFADHMLFLLPVGASAIDLASAGDNLADGYRTLAPWIRRDPEAPILIVGGRAWSIALYAVAAGVALGARSIDYVDHDPARLAIARRLGATTLAESDPTDGRYRITVDGSGEPEGLARALTALEPGGVCTSVGIYYTPTTPMPLRAMYGTGVTFVTGRANPRADLPAILDLVTAGKLDVSPVHTTVCSWDDAPDALLEPTAKVIVAREEILAEARAAEAA